MNPALKFQQAFALYQQGRLTESAAILEDLRERLPREPQVLELSAVVALQSGLPDVAAQRWFEQLRLEKKNPVVHSNLSMVLHELGRDDEAFKHASKAIRLDPRLPQAYNNLGNIYNSASQLKKAKDSYAKALQLGFDDPKVLVNLADVSVRLDEILEARSFLERAVSRFPDFSPAHTNLGVVLMQLGEKEAAVSEFSKASSLDPKDPEPLAGLASLHIQQRELDEAEAAARRALAIRPVHTGALLSLARTLVKKGEPLEARALLSDALARLAVADDTASLLGRSQLGFELGAVCDRLKEYDEAFTAYEEANRLKSLAEGRRYDGRADKSYHDHIRQAYSEKAWCERLRGLQVTNRDAGPKPIFILGFPRSGTSLLEQMLGAHPLVQPLGELTGILKIANGEAAAKLFGKKMDSMALLKLSDAKLKRRLAELRDYYLQHAAQAPGFDASIPWFTDKMPHNSVHVGLIRLLFPDSPVIRVVRHPLDCCLSAYFANFSHGHAYTSSYAETLGHFRNVMETFDAFSNFAPEGIAQVKYEELVDDPEKELRRLLEIAGLPWADACLRQEESQRVVRTASYDQVRSGVHKGSVFRYQNYLERIKEDIPVVADVIVRLGYPAVEIGV